jgi:hypothetical protein
VISKADIVSSVTLDVNVPGLKQHAMKTYGGEVKLHAFLTSEIDERSGYLYTTAALPQRK